MALSTASRFWAWAAGAATKRTNAAITVRVFTLPSSRCRLRLAVSPDLVSDDLVLAVAHGFVAFDVNLAGHGLNDPQQRLANVAAAGGRDGSRVHGIDKAVAVRFYQHLGLLQRPWLGLVAEVDPQGSKKKEGKDQRHHDAIGKTAPG